MKGKTPLCEEKRAIVRLLCLAAFFAFGIFLGRAAASCVPMETGEELSRYLQDYLRLEGTAVEESAVLSAVLTYVRYPLLAAFLGFTSLGIVLLPVVAAVAGFCFSFSVCCFAAAFGGEGVRLALAVLGLRCGVTLPCFFLLAVPAWSACAALTSFSAGKGRRVYDRRWLLRLVLVMLVLLAGTWVELWFLPRFVLRPALQRALF